MLYYLGILGILIWAVVPFRQYKKKYFIFFLALICGDLITLVTRILAHSGTNFFYVPFSFLALVSLLDKKFTKKYWIIIAILFLAFCIINLEYNLVVFSVIIIHLAILFILLKSLIVSFAKLRHVNIFLLLLIFYEITLIAKYINYLTGFSNDYYYYIITTVFEILFGIFFIIYKADDNKLVLQFK